MACILVIDDSPAVRISLRWTFEKAGHRVLEAEDGIEAMQVLRKQPVDLAVCDLCMPRQGGLETIRQVRRENLGVPVVAMSGSGWDVLEEAVCCGAASTLQKPFDAWEAQAAADRVLAGQPRCAACPAEGGSLRSSWNCL